MGGLAPPHPSVIPIEEVTVRSGKKSYGGKSIPRGSSPQVGSFPFSSCVKAISYQYTVRLVGAFIGTTLRKALGPLLPPAVPTIDDHPLRQPCAQRPHISALAPLPQRHLRPPSAVVCHHLELIAGLHPDQTSHMPTTTPLPGLPSQPPTMHATHHISPPPSQIASVDLELSAALERVPTGSTTTNLPPTIPREAYDETQTVGDDDQACCVFVHNPPVNFLVNLNGGLRLPASTLFDRGQGLLCRTHVLVVGRCIAPFHFPLLTEVENEVRYNVTGILWLYPRFSAGRPTASYLAGWPLFSAPRRSGSGFVWVAVQRASRKQVAPVAPVERPQGYCPSAGHVHDGAGQSLRPGALASAIRMADHAQSAENQG
ncbi:hypothetical protein CMUS01_05724 [Colletotrichum musicola]|uniref:Uncharacterized protein n=1 Tax=Colletotrichum musicola TaxID=2175873 RepID=A0A8H6KQQ5_9PEZI|nr:hypothetical protein CMUS01_05724 [Colletotrichum musicola]